MVDEDGNENGDGFSTERGCIFLFVAPELLGDPKVDLVECILADVRSPQLGESLTHCMGGVLHCSRADFILIGGAATIWLAMDKDPDGGNGVVTVSDKGVNVVFKEEGFQESPMCIHCFSHLAVVLNHVFSLTRQRSSRKGFCFRAGTFARALYAER
jgi:hypothetical protein